MKGLYPIDRAYTGLWHRQHTVRTPDIVAQFQTLLKQEGNPATILNKLDATIT